MKQAMNKAGLLRNRKSQVFVMGIIIIVTWGLISAFIILHYIYEPKTFDEYLGTYQSGMVDAITEGDKSFIYIDQAARYSVDEALQEFAVRGGTSKYDSLGLENAPECKSYIYMLWNDESKECYPDYKESFGQYMADSIISRLSTGSDPNFQKQIDYDFKYGIPKIKETSVKMIAKDKYDYFVFKNDDKKKDADTQTYIENKLAYSDGNIYAVGTGSCTDIVNFADKYIGVSWSKNTVAQPPDVAIRTGLQCGAFVSSAFRFGSGAQMATPLGNGNEKCYNFRTGTVSPAVELVYKRNTDYNCITSVACMKGLPSLSEQEFDNMKLQPGDIFSSTTPTEYGHPYGHTGIYVGKGKLETPINRWQYKKFIPDNNGKHVAIHSGVAYSYLSDLESNNRKMIAFCRHKACTSSANPIITIGCQTKDNDKWRITDLKAFTDSSIVKKDETKSISGDKNFEIEIIVQNDGDECALITSHPKITVVSGLQDDNIFTKKKTDELWPYSKDTVEVQTAKTYSQLGKKTYMATPRITCTFTTDLAKSQEEQSNGKCVLLAPSDDSKIKYKITAFVNDYMKNGKFADPELVLYIEVTKPAGVSPDNQQGATQPTKIVLTAQEQKKIDSTRTNLEKLGVWNSVEKYAKQYGVPQPILLGKITQETGADPKYANGCNSAGACGISQVVYSKSNGQVFHGKKGGLIDQACGRVYTRDEYIADKDCQIKSGALYLKQQYDAINGATLYYVCPRFCYTVSGGKQVCQDAVDKTYTGWEAALRRYNGGGDLKKSSKTSGCENQPDFTYVEKIMRWAAAWGYSGYETTTQYQLTATDEVVGKGMIGTYSIYPSFTVGVPFDFTLMDNLTDYTRWASNFCRISTMSKEDCLKIVIADFNKNVSKKYKDNNINVELVRNCDATAEERSFNGFIESLEDCVTAPEYNCRCRMNRTAPFTDIRIEPKEGSTLFYFKDKDGVEKSAESYIEFFDDSKKILSPLDYTSMKNIYILKKLGYMKIGTSNEKICDSVHNKYRLCLKTDYMTKEYDTDSKALVDKKLVLKFAITIRDNEPPPPITGLDLSNKKYTDKSLIIMFDESNIKGIKVEDVGMYRIYLSDNEAIFTAPMAAIKTALSNYRTIDIKNRGYTKYEDMDITQEPECELKDDGQGKYCVFKYAIKDIDGVDKKILLEDNKAYYLEDKKKFVYILNGTDVTNKLTDNVDKYILVTGIDIDGNEIDNVDAKQKITKGQNMKIIKPQDLLAPGFAMIKTLKWDITIPPAPRTLTIEIERPKLYIDGSVLDSGTPILYKAYTKFTCNNNNKFCMLQPPYTSIAELSGSAGTGPVFIDISETKLILTTDMTIGVISTIDKGNNNYKQYYWTFIEDVVLI